MPLMSMSVVLSHEERLCVKYTFVHTRKSEQDCCAFLIAWARDGHDRHDREHRKFFFPSESQLTAARVVVDGA